MNYAMLLTRSRRVLVPPSWDITTAAFLQSFSVAPQNTLPTQLFFRPDGKKLYVAGSFTAKIDEYNLASGWNVSTAVYGQSFSVSSKETNPRGVFFKTDGTKMYVMGGFQTKAAHEYTLATPWDVSTAVFVKSFSVSSQDTQPGGIFIRPDGGRMYVVGYDWGNINQYALSAAWDIGTASFTHAFGVGAQENRPHGVFFKPDGTKMYVVGVLSDNINQYNLSTAWDVSTASYVSAFSVAGWDTDPLGIFFKPDGTKVYVLGNQSDSVHEFNLSLI